MSRELAPIVLQRITTRRGGTVEGEETAAASRQRNAGVPVFSRAHKRCGRRRKHVMQSNGRQKLLASERVRRLLKKGSGSELQTRSAENGGATSVVLRRYSSCSMSMAQSRLHSDSRKALRCRRAQPRPRACVHRHRGGIRSSPSWFCRDAARRSEPCRRFPARAPTSTARRRSSGGNRFPPMTRR